MSEEILQYAWVMRTAYYIREEYLHKVSQTEDDKERKKEYLNKAAKALRCFEIGRDALIALANNLLVDISEIQECNEFLTSMIKELSDYKGNLLPIGIYKIDDLRSHIAILGFAYNIFYNLQAKISDITASAVKYDDIFSKNINELQKVSNTLLMLEKGLFKELQQKKEAKK
ncbi:hypothetical protein J7M07_04250 [bacterium]|nr:hypothetical protein [bacterium]